MHGGYKMISLEEINFIVNAEHYSDSHVIQGIYEKIENNYRKNILLGDIVIDNIERTERYITFGHSDDEYSGYLTISDAVNYRITIDADDIVTIFNE